MYEHMELLVSATCEFAAQVFESERCDFCFLPIDLPSVHFRCGHSFHIYCLSNNTDSKTGATQTTGLATASYCCAICTPQFNAKRVRAVDRLLCIICLFCALSQNNDPVKNSALFCSCCFHKGRQRPAIRMISSNIFEAQQMDLILY